MTTPTRPSGLAQQVSRAVAWNTLLAPLKTITELVSNIIILNILPLPHVGLLRLVSSAAASLGIWVDFGIDRALPRFIPELEQQQGRAHVGRFMTAIFLVKGALLVGFTVLFLLFSHRFTGYLIERVHQLPERFDSVRAALEQDVVQLTPWLIAVVIALVILGSFYDGLMAYLISYFRQRAWNLIGLLGSVLQPLLASILVLLGKGIGGVLAAMVITPVLSVVLAGWQVLQGHRSPPSPPPVRKPDTLPTQPFWKRFTLYTGMSNVLNISDYLISWYFAVFLLGDLAQVALYTTGTAMVRQALALLYTPLVGIQVPLFTRVRGGDGTLEEAYAAIGRILFLILVPGGVGLMLLAHEIILVQYPQYANAAMVVYVLTPCLFIESFLSSAQIVLQVYERYTFLILPRTLTLLIVPIMVWAASQYGLIGAALAVGGGRVVTGLVTLLLAHRLFPLRYSWRFFGRVTLAALGMIVVVMGLKYAFGIDTVGESIGERLIAAGLVLVITTAGAISFGVLLRQLGGLEADDRRRLIESRLPFRRLITKLVER
jgi:O-antigen/teichoic acid export membrane protein